MSAKGPNSLHLQNNLSNMYRFSEQNKLCMFFLIADPVIILQYFTSTSGVQWSGDYQRLGGAVELADYCPYLQVTIIFIVQIYR